VRLKTIWLHVDYEEKFLLVSLQFDISTHFTSLLFLIVNVSLTPPPIGRYHSLSEA